MLKKLILPPLIILSFNACNNNQFIWGGCKGNIPFESLKECKSLCEK